MWTIAGEPPFTLSWTLLSGDVPLHLRVEQNMLYMNTVSFSENNPFGAWGHEISTSFDSSESGRVGEGTTKGVAGGGGGGEGGRGRAEGRTQAYFLKSTFYSEFTCKALGH